MAQSLTITDHLLLVEHITKVCSEWMQVEHTLRPFEKVSKITNTPGWCQFCHQTLLAIDPQFLQNFINDPGSSRRLRAVYERLLFVVPYKFFEEQQKKYINTLPKTGRVLLKIWLKKYPPLILVPLLSDMIRVHVENLI